MCALLGIPDWGGVDKALEHHWPNPAVRLAYNPGPMNSYEWNMSKDMTSPSIRLAVCPASETGGANSVRHHLNECGLGKPDDRLAATNAMLKMDSGAASRYPHHKDYRPLNEMNSNPTVRLAHVDGVQGDGALAGKDGKGLQLPVAHAPALLVSYVYVEPFLKNRESYCYRDWVLDSGAFSAHNSGKVIDLNEYIDFCLKHMSEDKTLTEVFALDVVGDHEASIKNTEEMWRQGVPAIPCYHAGEPEEALYHIAKVYPKIALGGVALERSDKKIAWAKQCFARVWPKKIHGFAFCSVDAILGLPWHSTDATSWEIGPCAFGNWEKFGNMSVRGSNQDLRSQVKHYLDLEQKARVKWAKQMVELETLVPSTAVLGDPSVRLALNGPQMEARKDKHVLAPNVRLAVAIQNEGENLVNGQRVAFDKTGNAEPSSLKQKKSVAEKKPEPVKLATQPAAWLPSGDSNPEYTKWLEAKFQ